MLRDTRVKYQLFEGVLMVLGNSPAEGRGSGGKTSVREMKKQQVFAAVFVVFIPSKQKSSPNGLKMA